MTVIKTIKSFAEQSHTPKNIIRATIKQCGGWDNFKEIARDVSNHGANSGFVGFTYCNDTVSFTQRLKKDLIDFTNEQATEFGVGGSSSFIAGFNCTSLDSEEVAEAIYNPKSENKTEVFNALARGWLVVE